MRLVEYKCFEIRMWIANCHNFGDMTKSRPLNARYSIWHETVLFIFDSWCIVTCAIRVLSRFKLMPVRNIFQIDFLKILIKIMLLLTRTKFNYFPNRTFDLVKLFQERFVLFEYDLITVKPPLVYCVYHHSTMVFNSSLMDHVSNLRDICRLKGWCHWDEIYLV